MEKFAHLIARFLYRDLVYVLGGSLALITLFAGSELERSVKYLSGLSTGAVLLVGGFAWATGYLLQEAASMLGIVNTALEGRTTPSKLTQWAYRRFVGVNYEGPFDPIPRDDVALFNSNPSPESSANMERAIGLLTVSTCLGPTLLFCSGILLIQNGFPLYGRPLHHLIGYLCFAAILLMLARIKLLQMRAQAVGIITAMKALNPESTTPGLSDSKNTSLAAPKSESSGS